MAINCGRVTSLADYKTARSSRCTMEPDSCQPERPETLFFPETPNWSSFAKSHRQSIESKKRASNEPALGTFTPYKSRRPNRFLGPDSEKVEVRAGDPWVQFEKGIEIFPARHTFLARDREKKSQLVHIQRLEARAQSLLDTVSLHSHSSFLRLLDCYQNGSLSFLVWEPAELSLSQILGSKCSIRETEVVSIVWPVNVFPSVAHLNPRYCI